MSGLLLKLAPNERVLVNGLVIENGPKKTKMTIHSDGASVLRLRDAIHPKEISGPVSVAYYKAQLAVAGECEAEEAATDLRERLADLSTVFEGTWAAKAVAEARSCVETNNIYKAMRALGPLLPLEREMLGQSTQ